ncbi:MAG TPA: DUF6328 family protein [Candidatus Binatia bacterium]|nr:DUF6328 family protein [Candidatus Binatia bacterium]
MTKAWEHEEKEALSLSKAAEYLLEECRMVLPGIQALFGFQLIAVFNQSFGEKLSSGEQALHLAAIGLIAVAVALVMTPAAYHRQAGGRVVTEHFLQISTRLLLWSMLPLALGISIDFYLIARIILGTFAVAFLAAVLLAVFILLWFALPRVETLKRLMARGE